MGECKHEVCCWPNCDKNCNLVPDYNAETLESFESALIAHLQNRIKELKRENELLIKTQNEMYRDINKLEEKWNWIKD